MSNEKRTRGRKSQEDIPQSVIDEIIRFCDLYPSAYAAGQALQVSSTTIGGWRTGRFRPSQTNAYKMQRLSKGLIRASFILNEGRGAICTHGTLRDHIWFEHLQPMAQALNLETHQYLEDFYSLNFMVKLENPENTLTPEELYIVLGMSLDYWKKIFQEYHQKD